MQKTKKITTSVLAFLLITSFAATVFPMGAVQTTQAAPQSDENIFSIMQITDTQHLAWNSPALYNDTTSWIVNNSAAYNLKMVVHTGDLADYLTPFNQSQSNEEWKNVNASMGKLLDAGIPYCWNTGNHDTDPAGRAISTSRAVNYTAFNTTLLRQKPYWVSDFYDSKNTAVKFSVGNTPFMVITLEYLGIPASPGTVLDTTEAWMKDLLSRNYGVNVIVATHSYLNEQQGYGGTTTSQVAAIEGPRALAIKKILDSNPNVFLTLSGHIDDTTGVNMTRVGKREEILFNRQGPSNSTGAAAVRIYTFNLTKKQVNVSTYSVDTKTWLTDTYNQFTFSASLISDWTLVTDARPLKAYADLKETVWQKNATMPPNGQYDKIALHRLVKSGITPKGVIFIEQGANSGEKILSNPPSDNWTKEEKYSPGIYWANREFDVYALDKRECFAQDLNASERSSVFANWGYAQAISDYKEAITKAKEVSGTQKVFFFGFGTGGRTVLNYASLYWRQDLKGIILAASDYPSREPVVAKRGNETSTYNLTRTLANMIANGTGATDFLGISKGRSAYVLANPGAPAEYPPGTPVSPAINPLTNKSWTNITEFATWALSPTPGIGNLTLLLWNIASGLRYTPARYSLEYEAMAGWVNCPYLPYDYDDHWSEINVPLLSFTPGGWSNSSGTFKFVNGIGSTDFTPVMLPNYNPVEPIFCEYSARDVFAPTTDWMLSHLASLDVSAFSSVTVMRGWTWWFFAHNQGGIAPYKYQWYEGLNPIQGQTSMVLLVTKTTPGVYSFYCRVTDKDGTTTTSNPVALTVMS